MKWIKKVLYALFIIICTTLIFGSLFVKRIYPDVLFEELYFYLFNGVTDSDNSLIIMGLKNCLPLILFSSIIIYIVFDNLILSSIMLKKIKKIKYKWIIKLFLSILLFIISLFICMKNLNILDFLKYQNSVSNFIEENYVNPKEVKINFPDKKRNIITIFVESLETSMFTKKQGDTGIMK